MNTRPKRRGRGAPPSKTRATDYSRLRNPFPKMKLFSDDRIVALHAAGWLEGGLTISHEKLITDIEVLQMMAELCVYTPAEDAGIALDALEEVQPGGHFFGAAHTMARYQTEFYEPLVADFANIGTWQDRGSVDATTRATGMWKGILREFTPPPGPVIASTR